MLKKYFLLTLLVSSITSFTSLAKNDDVIYLEIVKPNKNDTANPGNDQNQGDELIEARLNNLTNKAKELGINNVSIIGSKNADKNNITRIDWNRLVLKDNSVNLSKPLESKIKFKDNSDHGDVIKAKGSKDILASALQDLLTKEYIQNSKTINKNGKSSSGSFSSEGDFISNSGSNGRLSAISTQPLVTKDVLTQDTPPETSITSDGCSLRVDYTLNKVFVQERTLIDGIESQSCRDSKTFFVLQKDYASCGNQIDLVRKKIIVNFQYFYNDKNNERNNIGNCQEDSSKSANVEFFKDYNACSDYIDLDGRKAFSQYQEYYKDKDGKNITVGDCTPDTNKSFSLIIDFESCGIKHLFDKGYSIAQKKVSYLKDSQSVNVQDCQEDSNYKYQHNNTSETCSPIISGNNITLLTRKFITVDGQREFITECAPLPSDTKIKEENCSYPEFTHDFAANQSFRNKTYFYNDLSGNRIEIFNCIKSQEAFAHQQDSNICPASNDDTKKSSNIAARKFITVDGRKEYISDCQTIPTPIPYREIGYKWKQEYSLQSASIQVNVADNVLIGSAYGAESSPGYKGNTTLASGININSYSKDAKCDNWQNPSYNSNQIDIAMSDRSSISLNNVVETKQVANACYNTCMIWSDTWGRCENMKRDCFSNYNYYQRCNNFRCPIAKYVKNLIYERGDGSKFIEETRASDVKYLCGNNISGSEVIY